MNGENKQRKRKIELAFSADGTRKCPYCRKTVEQDAVSCPYCHGSFISSHPLRNAIGCIILFFVLYWLLSAFISCEADREMKKISADVDREFDREMKKIKSELKTW